MSAVSLNLYALALPLVSPWAKPIRLIKSFLVMLLLLAATLLLAMV